MKMTDNEMLYIFRKEIKMAPGGQILEEKQITVQGKNLQECEKVFNKEWERKDDKK